MNEKIRQWVELLGIFAVVASLIFVGMQLMLDRRVAQSEQYYNRAEGARENLRALIQSEEHFAYRDSAWELGERPSWWSDDSDIAKLLESGKLSVRNLYFELLNANISLIGFDNNYYQYQQGFLDEENWQWSLRAIRRSIERSEISKQVFLTTDRNLRVVIDEIAADMGL